jgi:hypothetical protein
MMGRVQLRRCRIATMPFKKFAGALDIVCEQLGNIPVHVRPDHAPDKYSYIRGDYFSFAITNIFLEPAHVSSIRPGAAKARILKLLAIARSPLS